MSVLSVVSDDMWAEMIMAVTVLVVIVMSAVASTYAVGLTLGVRRVAWYVFVTFQGRRGVVELPSHARYFLISAIRHRRESRHAKLDFRTTTLR
jgi:hypothetical protein